MDTQKGNQTADTLLSSWIKSAADFWGSMLQNWTKYDAAGDSSAPGGKGRTQESFESVFNSWQALSTVAGDPGVMEAFSNLGRAMPEMLLQMVQAGWKSYFYLQQQWLEKAGRIGQSSHAFNFDNLDKEVFKAWSEIYEKEFRQFFYIP